MDDATRKPPAAAAGRASARQAAKRLLETPGPATARAAGGKLVAALDVRVQEGAGDGETWVVYEIVLNLHVRTSARARVVLTDGRTDEILRVLEEDLSSARAVRVPGSFPLAPGGEHELWCEANLVDEPEVRATAFAWVGPPATERRAAPRRPTED